LDDNVTQTVKVLNMSVEIKQAIMGAEIDHKLENTVKILVRS